MSIINNKKDLEKLYKLLGLFLHFMKNISEKKFEHDHDELKDIFYEYEQDYTYTLLKKVDTYVDKNCIKEFK